MKLFHLALASVMALPVMAWADWYDYDKTDDATLSINLDSIQYHSDYNPNVVGFTVKSTYHTDALADIIQDKRMVAGSVSTRQEWFDCNNATQAIDTMTISDAKGKVLAQKQMPSLQFESVYHNQYAFSAWSAACTYATQYFVNSQLGQIENPGDDDYQQVFTQAFEYYPHHLPNYVEYMLSQ